MRKKSVCLVLALSLVLASLICGCENPAKQAADTTMDMYEKEGEAQDAIDSFNESIQNNDMEADKIFDESKNSENYSFTFDGVKVSPNMDTAAFLDSLGEPLHYNEVQSCAFEGISKIYTYTSFVITTYPYDGKDLVSNVELKDDTVVTEENVYLSMGKDKVLEVYGANYVEKDGVFIYTKGNSKLQFIFQNDALVSVEYVTTALDEE